jgi:hypothetical protein
LNIENETNDQNDITNREELFDLYKIAIETDRFELELGWKLVQFFLLLNSGLLTVGFTLLGSNQITIEDKWLISLIFLTGIVMSIVSIKARKNYHQRSLVASCKKALIERILKLDKPIKIDGYDHDKNNLAISTSPKFKSKKEMLEDPVKYVEENTLKRWSVPFYHMLIFVALIVINGIGIVISLSSSYFAF